MVWIYGGSLQFGNAGKLCIARHAELMSLTMLLGQETYDGSSFAAYEDVIIVTTNYRTNGKL